MEEEKKAIERTKEILKEWQEIVDIEDTVEREIEMTLYAEDMPFNELKILVNLVEQLEKENKELKANQCDHNISNECLRKSEIRDKIEELESYIQEMSDEQGYWGSKNPDEIYNKIDILEEILGDE